MRESPDNFKINLPDLSGVKSRMDIDKETGTATITIPPWTPEMRRFAILHELSEFESRLSHRMMNEEVSDEEVKREYREFWQQTHNFLKETI